MSAVRCRFPFARFPFGEARLDQFIAGGGVSLPGFNPALPEIAAAP